MVQTMRLFYRYLYHGLLLASLLFVSGCTITITPGFKKASHKTSTAPMLKQVLPAVVNVFSEGSGMNCTEFLPENPMIRRQFGLDNNPKEQCIEQSQGSGVIVDAAKGYVVTNYHNIQDASRTLITLHDRRQLVASVVGIDPETDLALLKIEAKNLKQLTLGDADKSLEVGDFLVVIGSPFGLDHSVSFGVVSALGRSGLGLEGYEDFIQTDASINVGNSGGAVVGMDGRLVGLSTAVVGANNSNTGIGFAITGSMVRAVVDQIDKYGSVNRGQIGVLVDDVWVGDQQRAAITAVLNGSPASKSGIKAEDVVLKIDDAPVTSANKLQTALGLKRVGDVVSMVILRKGKTQTIKVTIGKRRLVPRK